MVERKFSRRGFWELIETRQITWINAVPAIITILAMDPPVATPGRVRFIRSASAPLAPSALRRFEETFGIPVVETYGMTEAASMITANPLDGPRKAGSAGLPAGTGDLGHLDQDGYLFLAGRSDDVINRGEEKIYPREIEEFLLTQPGVRSAVVVAARDEVLGQQPVAYVVPATDPGGPDLADALRAACEAELPRPKRPTGFCLVPELPLGATGKVSRRRLRELAAAPA